MKLKLLLPLLLLLCVQSYAQLPVEGFEGSFPPSGWMVINVSGAAQSWQHTILNVMPSYQGAYAAFINGEDVADGTVAEDWFISPAFTVPVNGQLQFYSQLSVGGNGGTYKIMIGTNPVDTGTFVELQSWGPDELAPYGVYINKTAALPVNAIGENRYIAFVAKGDAAHAWLIDNVGIQNGCNPPVNLLAANITTTAADLAWQSGGIETAWEIEVIPQGSTPTGTGTSVTVNPWIVTGLTPNTCYEYYVRAVCGQDEQSTWAGPFTFCLTANTITGTLRYDANGDGICNGNDFVLPNTEVQAAVNGATPYSVYTNTQGIYTLNNLPDGSTDVALQVIPPAGFATPAPLEQTVTFNGNIMAVEDICLPAPTEVVSDLAIAMIPVGQAKPGFEATYQMIIVNNGANAFTNLQATLNFNADRITPVSSNASYNVAGNQLTFALGDINPFASIIATITFNVAAPPVNNGGEYLQFYASLLAPAEEDPASLANNVTPFNQMIVNALDPNTIFVNEGEHVAIEELQQQDNYLHYTINFQNMGTAEATNIHITNILDSKLDWDSFVPLAASHSYTVSKTGNQLEFKFNGINLPDSTTDEAGSHGFISYKVKAIDTIQPNDLVSNTAAIYFDFNPAVQTNTTNTLFYTILSISDNNSKKIMLYPNPVNDALNIQVTDGTLQSVSIHDLNGRLCLTSANQQAIDTGRLTAGLYMVTVVTDKGTGNYKLIKK